MLIDGVFTEVSKRLGLLGRIRSCDMISTRSDNNDVYGLQQLISETTRITPTSSTLIDLIYTNINCADRIACSGVRHVAISDHSMVFAYKKLALKGMSNGNNTVTYRNFRNFDRQSFPNDISSQS